MITRKLQQTPGGQMFLTLPKQSVMMLNWEKGNRIKMSFDKNKIIIEKE